MDSCCCVVHSLKFCLDGVLFVIVARGMATAAVVVVVLRSYEYVRVRGTSRSSVVAPPSCCYVRSSEETIDTYVLYVHMYELL